VATQFGNDQGHAYGANDPLLRDVLGSATEDLREAAIAELLASHVYWRVDRILSARFRRCGVTTEQQEDVRAETLLKLMSRLRRLIADPESTPLNQFADYVAVVTFNSFDDFVRRTYPLRTKLKHRVLYALRHSERFALWERGNVLLCGLAEWAGQASLLRMESEALSVLAGTDLRLVLADLFAQAGGPLEVEQVVSRIARAQHSGREEAQELREETATTHHSGSEELENLQSLERLWSEIGELPVNQRVALLLSARDTGGESVLRLLPLTGVATIRQIAETLLIPAPALADLWHALPLDDNRIAAMLQMTRQQVINLRRSARDRLTRRLRGRGPARRRAQ
jgi:hypothetical protein